jgi:hypothetical protein
VAFSFLQRGNPADHARLLSLSSYTPSITLGNLQLGVDNIRHDVWLSPRISETAHYHISKLVAKHGQVEDMAAEDPLAAAATPRPSNKFMGAPSGQPKAPPKPPDATEFKRQLADLHIAALNRAKGEENVSLDLLARLAIVKFLRNEVFSQYTQVLEKCRAKLKSVESLRHTTPQHVQMRERFWRFQVGKKAVLRRVGQELFATLREIEKETLARMRRSLFGENAAASYDLFTNRLLFTEDGRDDYLNAEHYVMLGNYERDPDRFETMQEIALQFLKSLEIIKDLTEGEHTLDAVLSSPENAQELVAGGTPNEGDDKGRAQKALLGFWVDALESQNVMQHVIASYEAVPLLGQYSPPINAQQLKNALISRTERKRVETLLEEHGKISPDNLNGAVKKVEGCKGTDRAKMAGRFLSDFIRYHRDLRRLECLVAAMDAVNVIQNDKLRELSAINNTLYEFLLPEEQRPTEEKVVHHVVLKADVRDSTTLTRTLADRGQNPASYFSLNFYEPVNRLIAQHGATKVFIEGDAVILALFEREGEPGFGVGRTCVLAREMIQVVNAYNQKSLANGLPALELGIGVCFQDSPPMFLMDGSTRIMISKALNESDRLSSCTKGARKFLAGADSLFNVFSFQSVDDEDTGGMPEEFLVRYNIGGVNINPAAFEKLKKEISLQLHELKLPMLYGDEIVKLYSGLVPLPTGSFQRIVVREGRIPHIDAREFSLKHWTERSYFEVVTNPAVYEYIESGLATAAGTTHD